MNIVAFTTSHWNTREEAERQRDGLFGLIEWQRRIEYLFRPVHTFLACGTYSDPSFSPLAEHVAVVNSGAARVGDYDVYYRQYASCAATAAMAYALNRSDWEFLVTLDPDVLVGAVDFGRLLEEFRSRPEVILTNRWCGFPAGPFVAYKRRGAAMFLHQRRRANIISADMPLPMLAEQELGEIFKGAWWDAWPEIDDVRQDFSVNQNDPNPMRSLRWPFVRQPHPAMIEEHLATQWAKARPV